MSAKKPPDEKIANIAPFGLRMPAELKEQIGLAASKSGRSMNAEIVALLQVGLMAEDLVERAERSRSQIEELKLMMAVEKERYARNIEEAAQLLTPVTERANEYKKLFLGQVNVYLANIANFRSVCRLIKSYGEEVPDELQNLANDMIDLYSKRYQASWKLLEAEMDLDQDEAGDDLEENEG